MSGQLVGAAAHAGNGGESGERALEQIDLHSA
jgi:hypothetical protein